MERMFVRLAILFLDGNICFAECGVNNTTPQLTWTYSDPDDDEQASYQVLIVRTADSVTVLDTEEVASSNAFHNVSMGVIEEGEKYSWQVRVKDTRGGWSQYSSQQYFFVLAPPSNLALDPTQTTVEAIWSSNGNLNGAVYQLWRSNALIYEGTNTTYTDTGLAPSTSYQYAVNAKADDGEPTASDYGYTITLPLASATIIDYIYDDNGRLTRRIITQP